jgi:release factor glutamine methyltransferase
MRIAEALWSLTAYLGRHGVEHPGTDAEWLLSFVIGCKRLELFLMPERVLTAEQMERLRALSVRRAQREPLQYVVGEVDFFGQKLHVDKRVLIPRPETEELVYQMQQYLTENFFKEPSGSSDFAHEERQNLSILDLGTGSGAIAIALAALFPIIKLTAVDCSAEALAVAEENSVKNNVRDRISFVQSDWFSNIKGTFDVIISNPPYVSEEEYRSLQSEVRCFEPKSALTAEDEGLADLKHIPSKAPEYLKRGGLLVMETGCNQHTALHAYAKTFGYAKTQSTLDLSHRERYFWAWM